MKMLVVIGKNIRKYRKQKSLSQEKLAELADLSMNYIGNIERGERNLSLRTLQQVTDALNIEPVELFKV